MRDRTLSIKAKLGLLSAIFALGMVLLGSVTYFVLSEVRIGGPLFGEIERSNMINSEFKLPRGHLVGLRLVLFMMIDAANQVDQSAVAELAREFEAERKEYEDLNQEQLATLPDGEMKERMEAAYRPGHAYLELAKDQLVPLLLHGRLIQATPVRDQLNPLFEAHEKASKALIEFNRHNVIEIGKRADQTVRSRSIVLIAVALLIFGLVPAICTVIAKGIIGPLQSVVEIFDLVADGDFTGRLEVGGTDEIARLGGALNRTIDKLSTSMTGIEAEANVLSGESSSMSTASERLGAIARETSSDAAEAAAAAAEVNQALQTVSSATEQMTASVAEISKSATLAAEVASSAARLAGSTAATMTKLTESSGEIGNVIKLITAIAGQTNLLALNATIEAARAGEAGRGFAVVANEVKELAKETARATEDIGAKVEAIQSDAKSAVSAIDEINSVIGRINDIQSTIAGAVEEQTSTTKEISRNITETVAGTGRIAENIGTVAKAATETQQSALSSQRAAQKLAQLAGHLTAAVGQFKLTDTTRMSNALSD